MSPKKVPFHIKKACLPTTSKQYISEKPVSFRGRISRTNQKKQLHNRIFKRKGGDSIPLIFPNVWLKNPPIFPTTEILMIHHLPSSPGPQPHAIAPPGLLEPQKAWTPHSCYLVDGGFNNFKALSKRAIPKEHNKEYRYF